MTQPARYAEESQATIILVLGILGLVICGLLGPVAWVMGNNEVQAIDAGRRPPENRQMANIGRILGIIATALIVLGILFFIVVIGIGGIASVSS